MSDEDIDLDRVIVDPAYRREVIDFLKKEAITPRERTEAVLVDAHHS